MSCCRKWRPHVIETAYGELEGERRRAFEEHLATCEGCAAELASLEATIGTLNAALPPRPRDGEIDVWSRVAPEIDALERGRRERLARGRQLVLGYPMATGLAAALLVLGIGLGRLAGPPTPAAPPDTVSPPLKSPQGDTIVAETPNTTPEADDPAALYTRYLERATPLLLAVANRGTPTAGRLASFDSTNERRLATRLAADAERLDKELEDSGRGREAALVRDLGIVFLQISNLPENEYRGGIEMVQATIEKRALLFQLTVEEIRRVEGPAA